MLSRWLTKSNDLKIHSNIPYCLPRLLRDVCVGYLLYLYKKKLQISFCHNMIQSETTVTLFIV